MQTSNNNSLVVRGLEGHAAVVMTPQSTSYGSLEEQKLDHLREEVERNISRFLSSPRAADGPGVRGIQTTVIFDLSCVRHYGSEFLRLIFVPARALMDAGSRVVVCGDQTGLVKLLKADRWLTVCDDLVSALNWMASVERASAQGFRQESEVA